MKRTPMKRGTPMKRATKPLRSVNPEREAKRRKRHKKAHAAYRASGCFKVVERRAAGQCEGSLLWEPVTIAGNAGVVIVDIRDSLEWMAFAHYVRCVNAGGLSHHHRTYARSGGNENPDDMCVLCKRCHEYVERRHHPTRKNGRRVSSSEGV